MNREKIHAHLSGFWQPLWEPPRFIGFKICAALLAILLWFYVMETQNPMTEESYTVPVEMRNLSAKLAIPDTNRQVTIRVQGSSSAMNELSSRKIFAYCDFSDVEEGEATLPVQVELPEGVTMVNVLPESISFSLEAVVSDSFPLEVHIHGEPAESYKLLDAVLNPDVVTLSGSQKYLDQVASVFVSADVTELSENYNKNLSVEVLDRNGNNISDWFTCTPATVAVMIPVVYAQPEKTVAVSPVYVGEPATGYRVSRVVVEPATVRALGDLEVLSNLYYVETTAIDISGLKKTTSFTAQLKHGNNVTLSANAVTIVMQVEPESSATLKKNLVYYENLKDGLACTLPNTELEITLCGVDTDINNLDEKDIVPFVDLSQISSPGVYTLPIQVNRPANVSLISTKPSTVDVTVEKVDVDTREPQNTEKAADKQTDKSNDNSDSVPEEELS